MRRSQPDPNVQRIAATYPHVVKVLRESIKMFPDHRFLAQKCIDSLYDGALVSTDTLDMLHKMDKYEKMGMRPEEALNKALNKALNNDGPREAA